MRRTRVLVFDVNETLLDLAGLDGPFERAFGTATVREEWFTRMIRDALLTTIVGPYRDFGAIGKAALAAIASRHGVDLPEGEQQAILGGLRTLRPHPEVPVALGRLREDGFRLAALTNSTEEVARMQMENSGLAPFFEAVLSADTARCLKPAPKPYRMAAERLGVEISRIRLVAAHDWDVAGAIAAGCAAAFVARPGRGLDPLFHAPDIVGPDLQAVAESISARDS